MSFLEVAGRWGLCRMRESHIVITWGPTELFFFRDIKSSKRMSSVLRSSSSVYWQKRHLPCEMSPRHQLSGDYWIHPRDLSLLGARRAGAVMRFEYWNHLVKWRKTVYNATLNMLTNRQRSWTKRREGKGRRLWGGECKSQTSILKFVFSVFTLWVNRCSQNEMAKHVSMIVNNLEYSVTLSLV